MSRLLETIKVLDGAPQNIIYHNRRMNDTRKALFNSSEQIDLAERIVVPPAYREGVVKCRCIYDNSGMEFEFIPYVIKNIGSVRPVNGGAIEYHHKYEDRSQIEQLQLNSGADEIIIIKDGLVTDSSYANLIFNDGARWVTPATPLLKGTMRQKLLDEGRIIKYIIPAEMVPRFRSFKLINAMLDINESPELPISLINL